MTRTPSLLPGLLLSVSVLAGCLPAGRGPTTPPLRGGFRPPSATFEGDLEGRLRGAPAGRSFTVLVDLTDQLDLDAFTGDERHRRLSKRERRASAIGALEGVAAAQQARLRPRIDAAIRDGTLDYARPVAIVNRLVVEGSAAGILALSTAPEVARVLDDWTSRPRSGRSELPPERPGETLPDRFRSWAIPALGADRLWREGWTGKGVVVASIDTGVYREHEQLEGRVLSSPRGWFDPVEGSAAPHDPHGHGTGVMSVAVGGNPGGRIVGVAPEASWASALGNWQNYYSRSRMTLAADWILRVARPDVLVNPWSHDQGTCSDFDLPFIRAWQAAEIFVAFPSGNAGPGEATGECPAQLAGALPGGAPVFSVAGLAPNEGVPASSSRGPSRCGSPEFPIVAAPGAELPYALPGSPRGYLRGEGTSFAVGLVGGGAALLLQAVPEASAWEVARALRDSARDLPPEGRDDRTGYGAVDLPGALARLRARTGRR